MGTQGSKFCSYRDLIKGRQNSRCSNASNSFFRVMLIRPCSLSFFFIQPAIDCYFYSGVIVFVPSVHYKYMVEKSC